MPNRRRTMVRISAPTKAITIWLMIGCPGMTTCTLRALASRLAAIPPMTPITMSPTSPIPCPSITWLARNPATSPTNAQSRSVCQSRLSVITFPVIAISCHGPGALSSVCIPQGRRGRSLLGGLSAAVGAHDQLVHPGRRHHVHRHAVGPGQEQKVAPLGGLEIGDLALGQVEGALELEGLGVLLRAQQQDAGIRGQHCAVLGLEEVPRILADQDQAALVFADAAREPNQDAPSRFVLQQQAGLVDQQVPRA